MTPIQLIREFASTAIGERVTIARHHMENNWGMDVNNKPNPRLIIPTIINYTPDEEDKLFRINFEQRCKWAYMFTDITLAILHELGHWATRHLVDWVQDYDDRIGVAGEAYFYIHSEYIATNWAIQWLSDDDNRKIAQQFDNTISHC